MTFGARIEKGKAILLNKRAFEDFVKTLAEGEFLSIIVKTAEQESTEGAFKYFHKLRDRYAEVQGYSSEYAKNELCVQWGVSTPYVEGFKPPEYPGVFVELWDRHYFRKSTLAYTSKEMAALIERTTRAIIEAGGEVGDLV